MAGSFLPNRQVRVSRLPKAPRSGCGLDTRPGWAMLPLSGASKLEAVPNAETVFDDRRDFLLRRDRLLLFYRWRMGALVGHVMP